MSSETMTIQQMSADFEVTPRTLRYYESIKLLCPQRSGQHRIFSKGDRVRLKLILRGKRFGFSLEEIRQLLDLYEIGDQQRTQFQRTYELAQERLQIMEKQRRQGPTGEGEGMCMDYHARRGWGAAESLHSTA